MDGFRRGSGKVVGYDNSILADTAGSSRKDLSMAADLRQEARELEIGQRREEVPKITCRRCQNVWDAELILFGCPECEETIC